MYHILIFLTLPRPRIDQLCCSVSCFTAQRQSSQVHRRRERDVVLSNTAGDIIGRGTTQSVVSPLGVCVCWSKQHLAVIITRTTHREPLVVLLLLVWRVNVVVGNDDKHHPVAPNVDAYVACFTSHTSFLSTQAAFSLPNECVHRPR